MKNFFRPRFIAIVFILFFGGKIVCQSYQVFQKEAEEAFNSGEFANAFKLAEKSLQTAKKEKQKQSVILPLEADYAYYMSYAKDGSSAIDYLADIMDKVFKKERANDMASEMYMYKILAYIYKDNGWYHDGFPAIANAYDLAQKNKENKNEYIEISTCLAEFYQYLYKFNEAEQLYLNTIQFAEENGLGKSVTNATTYSGLSLLYLDMFNQIKALQTFEKAENIFKSANDTLGREFAIFLMNYGTVLAEVYRFDEALNKLFRSKTLHQKLYGKDAPEYAGILNNIGYVYAQLGKNAEAEQYYTTALEIKKMNKRTRFDSYLASINNLFYFYHSAGRDDKAKEMLAELEKGIKDSNMQDDIKRITYAQNIASYYMYHKNYDKATSYFNEALSHLNRIYRTENIETGSVYISLAFICLEKKDYDCISENVNKISNIFTKTADTNLSDSYWLMRNLGILLINTKQYKEAESVFTEAKKFAEQGYVKGDALVSDIYLNLSIAQSGQKNIKPAIENLKKFLEMKYAFIEEHFSYMTEKEKMQFLDKTEELLKNLYVMFTDYAADYPEIVEEVLNFRIRIKGILLNNISKIKNLILERKDSGLLEQYEKIKLNREQISKLMTLDKETFPEAQQDAALLYAETDKLEKNLSAKLSGINVSGNKNLTWQELQKLLTPNEYLIETIRTKMMYNNNKEGVNYSFIIVSHKGKPQLISIDKSDSWEDITLEKYRKSIDEMKDNPDLTVDLFGKILQYIGTNKVVYFSPDGIYTQINLNTLYSESDKKYLIEKINLHYINNLQEFEKIKKTAAKKIESAVLVGNPDFSYDLSKLNNTIDNNAPLLATRNAYGFKLDQLPGTMQEVNEIGKLMKENNIQVSVLTGDKAHEKAIKEIKNPDILHIATHGFFMEDFPEENLEALSQVENVYYRNPMVRSGLFFSGANNTYTLNTNSIKNDVYFEDGMLTAYEAMNLSLDKTQLVVLSACQTGLGKVRNGEGVYGLQRAFKLAGAKSLIMSLWPVSDDATMELMITFYKNYLSGKNMHESFHRAQLQLKQKYPQPYYWGAFVLTGQ